MSMNVNKVILIGHVGIDPVCNKLANDMSVCKFTLATNEKFFSKKDNEKKSLVEWHNVSCFGKLADVMITYLKKGQTVYVEGKIKSSKYKDKEGNDRMYFSITANEIIILSEKNDNYNEQPKDHTFDLPFKDDEIPF